MIAFLQSSLHNCSGHSILKPPLNWCKGFAQVVELVVPSSSSNGKREMRIFLAGIMQGSHRKAALHDQQYRGRLRTALQRYLPGCEIYDPLTDHADSLEYGEAKGREVFMQHNRMCGDVDIVLACVPEASMGTAIEMWEAYRHGKVVLTISPMKRNWAVKFLSHILYEDEQAFEQALMDGSLRRRLTELGVEE